MNLFNLYGKVYVANFDRIEVEEPQLFSPGHDNVGMGQEGHMSKVDLVAFIVYSSVGCPDDHFGQVHHVESITELLKNQRDELYASEHKIALVVPDEEFELLLAERLASARQLVGLDEGDGGRLYRGCKATGLPLELCLHFVKAGADSEQFNDKLRAVMMKTVLHFVNHRVSKLKCILPFDMECFDAIARALGVQGSLAFPDSIFKNVLLGKAIRGQLSIKDFASPDHFRQFCLEISAMHVDAATGKMYRDYSHSHYLVVKQRVDIAFSDKVAELLRYNLYMLKPYLVAKGDRFDLESLTDSAEVMLLHPQWWKNEEGYNAGVM